MAARPNKPWTCPACLRVVPARVETCYCGLHRSQAPVPAAARDPGTRGFVWSALGVVAVGASIAVFTLGRQAPEPRAEATPIPQRPPATAATTIPPVSQAPAVPAGEPASNPVPARPLVAAPSPSDQPSSTPTESLDDLRDKAAQAYDSSLQQLAARVESFRLAVRDYQNGCRSGGGPWPPSGCDAVREDLRHRLDEIRTSVETSDEEARRAAVYPGVRAQIRRRHGLDEEAWSALLRRSLETLE